MKLFLIGGFLGSGKTTAIKNACIQLINKHVSVAVITNDQGASLVDTGFIKSFGISSDEVLNGCFCCNYDQLTASLDKINNSSEPQIIFAESVGSCTDLIATVAKPLNIFYPQTSIVVSVFADASLLASVIAGESLFVNESVQYLYKKQLEEADILVINKIDLLSEEQLCIVKKQISEEYQNKIVLYQNSLDEKSVEHWMAIANKISSIENRKSLDIDYDIYAEGEAMLGWLDEEVEITSVEGRANELAIALINNLEAEIRKQFVIGHLKFLVDDENHKTKISYTTMEHINHNNALVANAANKVSLLINARVEANPKQLKGIISKLIIELANKEACSISIKQLSAFSASLSKAAIPFRLLIDQSWTRIKKRSFRLL